MEEQLYRLAKDMGITVVTSSQVSGALIIIKNTSPFFFLNHIVNFIIGLLGSLLLFAGTCQLQLVRVEQLV